MKKTVFAASAAMALMATPALADEARTPPPSEPYYAPQTAQCETVDLQVYFKPGTTELTTFSRDVIQEAREQLQGCAVVKIDAASASADAETRSGNLSLADERRATVIQELQAHGLTSQRAQLQSDITAEEAGSVMSRNVNIVLEAEPAMVG